jgi:phosphatidylglycerol lysyltransferase
MPAHFPARDLWRVAAGGLGYGARYFQLRARAARISPPDATDNLLRLQSLYGYNAHSLASVAPGTRVWTTPEIDGAVVYNESGRVWLATGDPLAAEPEVSDLARQFILAAQHSGSIAAFVPVTTRFAESMAGASVTAVKIGAAPYFDLKSWGPRGDRAKRLRAGLNQARRAGVVIEAVQTVGGRLCDEAGGLCRAWLRSRRAATNFGWLFTLDPFRHAAYKRFFTARDATGRLVGLLAASPIPARDAWYLEDVLRLPDSPPGTTDLLVVTAFRILREEGAGVATLGTCPLATDGEVTIRTGDHRLVESALRLSASRLDSFYNFAGVRSFKAKFVPSWWESEYAIASRGLLAPPRVAYAVVRAILPSGVTSLLSHQAMRAGADRIRMSIGRPINK